MSGKLRKALESKSSDKTESKTENCCYHRAFI